MARATQQARPEQFPGRSPGKDHRHQCTQWRYDLLHWSESTNHARPKIDLLSQRFQCRVRYVNTNPNDCHMSEESMSAFWLIESKDSYMDIQAIAGVTGSIEGLVQSLLMW